MGLSFRYTTADPLTNAVAQCLDQTIPYLPGGVGIVE